MEKGFNTKVFNREITIASINTIRIMITLRVKIRMNIAKWLRAKVTNLANVTLRAKVTTTHIINSLSYKYKLFVFVLYKTFNEVWDYKFGSLKWNISISKT